jgi:hypothetical protein
MYAPNRIDFSKRVARMAFLVTSIAVGLWASEALAQSGTVLSEQKISATEGGFTGTLDFFERFGCSLTSLGDLDSDGIGDLAVGAMRDDDGGTNRGAVWMLFLDIDGTVKSHQKISDTEGGFAGALDDEDSFGFSVAALEDLDGDGVRDLAVGAAGDDDGGTNQGAVWILFLDPNGTVKSHQKISSLEGTFTGALSPGDNFGYSVASLGDINGDGESDLAVGAIRDDDGGTDQGAVWILFLNPDGNVNSHQKISSTQGGFTGMLNTVDYFGNDVAVLGDLDGDGVNDLAVGAAGDDDGGHDHGAVWILFLDPNGTVRSHQKISSTEGGFTGTLSSGDNFGVALTQLAVLDGDGVVRLAAGAKLDDYPEPRTGAVWILFLHSDGTVHSHQKIGGAQGGFMGTLDSFDYFGFSAASLGDLNGDGVSDLAVGAVGDDDGGEDRGAVWLLFLDGPGALAQCQAELDEALLALEECRARADEDHDGEPDQSDRCPGTRESEAVDDAGCSTEQFCASIRVRRGRDALRCLRADWRNDEPLRRHSRDCTLAWAGEEQGWPALRCTAR